MDDVLSLRPWHAFSMVLLVMITIAASDGAPQTATIIDSGSTNRSGMRVTVDRTGNARALSSAEKGEETRLRLSGKLCSRLMQVLTSARPLQTISAKRCMKSTSFGSSLFIEFEGERSPDLSCPGQTDKHAAALQKAANEILQAAARQYGTKELIR